MVKCKKCNNREKDADAIDVTIFVMSLYIRLGNYLKFKVCHNVYSMHLVIFHEISQEKSSTHYQYTNRYITKGCSLDVITLSR